MKNFIYRSLRFLRRKLVHHISWNKHYAVNELFRKEHDNVGEGVNLIKVLPNCETFLQLPDALASNLSKHLTYDPFVPDKKNVMKIMQDYYVAVIEKGRLYSDNISSVAVFSKSSKLINEVSYFYRSYNGQEINTTKFFKRKFFIKPKYYDGTVLSLLSGGGGVWNYFHWMLDTLPKIELVKKAGLFNQIKWFLVPSYEIEFQVSTLKHLGIQEEKIIVAKEDTHIVADLMLATSNTRGDRSNITPKWIIEFLLNAFAEFIVTNSKYSKRIFISRSDSKRRIVLNEGEVVDFLTKRGFEYVVLSKLSVKEKIELFSNADFIIGGSGAGLVNLLFCKPSTTVLEIFTEGFVNMDYYSLADVVGLNYNFMVCTHDRPAESVISGGYEDTFVDMEEFKLIYEKVERNAQN